VSDTLPPTDGWKVLSLDETGTPHSYNDKHSLMRGAYQKAWTYRGEFHRLDKPAVIFGENEYYYTMGVLHRVAGPALRPIFGQGYSLKWYLYGEKAEESVVSSITAKSLDRDLPFYIIYLIDKLSDFDTSGFTDENYREIIKVPLTMLEEVLHLNKGSSLFTENFMKVASLERKKWISSH